MKSKLLSICHWIFFHVFGPDFPPLFFGKLRMGAAGRSGNIKVRVLTRFRRAVSLLHFETLMLTLKHGIGTGSVNHSTFQSTVPRAGILKLEDCHLVIT
jgi:hypothetical protein